MGEFGRPVNVKRGTCEYDDFLFAGFNQQRTISLQNIKPLYSR